MKYDPPHSSAILLMDTSTLADMYDAVLPCLLSDLPRLDQPSSYLSSIEHLLVEVLLSSRIGSRGV